MSDEETTIDEVPHEMLWSRRDAARLRRAVPLSLFGALAAVAAVIEDHDRTRTEAPTRGPGRVESIAAHTLALTRTAAAISSWDWDTRMRTALYLRVTTNDLPLTERAAALPTRLVTAWLTQDTAPAWSPPPGGCARSSWSTRASTSTTSPPPGRLPTDTAWTPRERGQPQHERP